MAPRNDIVNGHCGSVVIVIVGVVVVRPIGVLFACIVVVVRFVAATIIALGRRAAARP